MNYTKEQLQGMSDAEINEVIHKLAGRWINGEGAVTYALGDKIIFQNEAGLIVSTDYCNSPSDIMPLAFKHKLTISPQLERFDIPSTGLWVSTDQNWNGKYSVMDKNPLRAITCCLILVLQENNNV